MGDSMGEMDEGRFCAVVEGCVKNIRSQTRSGVGMRMTPASQGYLAIQTDQDIAAKVVSATRPAVRRILCQPIFAETDLLALTGDIGFQKQGVYANIMTCATEYTSPQIYVGGAAGPYSRRSRGVLDQIRTHQNDAKRRNTPSSLHHRKLQMHEWHANWAILVSFSSEVERQLVVFAHAIMIILFGSSIKSEYAACRPTELAPTPPQWGLNETCPLSFDGLSSYNKLDSRSDREEIGRTRERLRLNSFIAASTRKRQRLDRLKGGGPIHVNVLKTGSRIRRFFITPMTAADGAHLDITIPREIGLGYGLEQSRTVHMRLDMSVNNHHTPYALKSERNSPARQLGILVTGSIAYGPRKGAEFTHWLQTSRKEGPAQAENLIKCLNSQGVTIRGPELRVNDRPSNVVWAEGSFVSSTQRPAASGAPNPRNISTMESETVQDDRLVSNEEFSTMITQLVRRIQGRVLSRKMRVTPAILLYFKEHSAISIARSILESIRQPVVDMFSSGVQFTTPQLLSIGGNIDDRSQGVYADIVTNENPSFFRIYVGSASSSTLHQNGKSKGLKRRIRQHLAYARSKIRKPPSGQLHCNEIRKERSHCNFVVLVRFAQIVGEPLVHIAEAIMAILFASWNSQTFTNLRPTNLPSSLCWGLNNANPLDYGVSSFVDSKAIQFQKDNGRRMAQKRREVSVAKAKEGGHFRVTAHQVRPSYWDFQFHLCGETIKIPSELGLSMGLHLQRCVHVYCEVSATQHESPYTTKASWGSNERRLGICLKECCVHGHGSGKAFTKWVQCNSIEAAARAKRIIEQLDYS